MSHELDDEDAMSEAVSEAIERAEDEDYTPMDWVDDHFDDDDDLSEEDEDFFDDVGIEGL